MHRGAIFINQEARAAALSCLGHTLYLRYTRYDAVEDLHEPVHWGQEGHM